jgi:hypothetical protein
MAAFRKKPKFNFMGNSSLQLSPREIAAIYQPNSDSEFRKLLSAT